MMEPAAPPLLPYLRTATLEDAAGVAALLHVLGYPCSREDARQRIALIEADSRQCLVIADYHGDHCGLVALHALYSLAHGTYICRITALVVAPTYQRRGIGRLLLREAHAWARGVGAARIEVTSAAYSGPRTRFTGMADMAKDRCASSNDWARPRILQPTLDRRRDRGRPS